MSIIKDYLGSFLLIWESRITNVDTEWELNRIYFAKIVKKWGDPEIDLQGIIENANYTAHAIEIRVHN